MPDKGTSKKLTKVGGGEAPSTQPAQEGGTFAASGESKGKARAFRLIAVLAWLLAIGAEVGAILLLRQAPVSTLWLIVLIAADLVFAVAGSLLWKKSNRLDPASKKEPVKFFIQNQLGLLISIIAFVPLIILIFTNKNMDGKQKGLVGVIAVVALAVAGYFGIDFNPPSIEQYAEQTSRVQDLSGANSVFWTQFGKSYHLYADCSYINTAKTDEIFQGTVAQAREIKSITDLCDRCESRAVKEQGAEAPAESAADGS